MKKTKALTPKEKQREYQRKWYAKNRAKNKPEVPDTWATLPDTVIQRESEPEVDPFLDVLAAYATLFNATNDPQIKKDANKLLAAILPKL